MHQHRKYALCTWKLQEMLKALAPHHLFVLSSYHVFCFEQLINVSETAIRGCKQFLQTVELSTSEPQ